MATYKERMAVLTTTSLGANDVDTSRARLYASKRDKVKVNDELGTVLRTDSPTAQSGA
jgi:hypothetical protein